MPPFNPSSASYRTAGGLDVARTISPADPSAFESLALALDERRGCLFSSGVESPGRYRRRGIGFVDPPLVVAVRDARLFIDALNARGSFLIDALAAHMPEAEHNADGLALAVPAASYAGVEEERTRRSSVFTLLRRLVAFFAAPDDPWLGFYGAFGYDLAFALEDVPRCLPRAAGQRDLLLYLPDALIIYDPTRNEGEQRLYDFSWQGRSTRGLDRRTESRKPVLAVPRTETLEGKESDYPERVEAARRLFKTGSLFELVLSQTFRRALSVLPSTVFSRLRQTNPAPYEALMNLGEGEHLASASPEMFVRVQSGRVPGLLVETCPISGTIRRGGDALADAANIRSLLNSAKDEAELTMCTDVDRNDKARVCIPGSIRVVGRRMLEMYARLIHTVDHVEGTLRTDMDALDAFLTHTWAVTVTGAPKLRAMRTIEAMETSPRLWYGGAFGRIGFDGSMDTGLTLRTMRLFDGIAEVRAGATLLYDSDPEAEDAECLLKASALLTALEDDPAPPLPAAHSVRPSQRERDVLLIDHEDSFVLSLADCFRRFGAKVVTLRPAAALEALADAHPDLIVLSPGPGHPSDFPIKAVLDHAAVALTPVFGVCLGLQGMVDYCGGTLALLPTPVHGKASAIVHDGKGLFEGLPHPLSVGRYHSLYGATIPPTLETTARTEDGVPMAVRHRTYPWSAVQFHPESILSAENGHGERLIANLLASLEHDGKEAGRKNADAQIVFQP